jgi:hypothetical protein
MTEYIATVNPKCKVYNIGKFKIRYLLDIETEKSDGGSALCIMMNPSKADENESDSSVNKVIEFFKKEYRTIKICNLIPIYLTKSSEMNQLFDEFQEEKCRDTFCEIIKHNFTTISREINELDKDARVVLAWGDPPEGFDKRLHQEYVDKVLASIESLPNYYIFETNNPHGDITKLGNPRHPSRNTLTGLLKIKTVKYRHIVMSNDESSNTCD